MLSGIYPTIAQYRSWSSARMMVDNQLLLDIIQDREITTDDISRIISGMKSYSYNDSHMTSANCNPEIYDCYDIPEPTDKEKSDKYFKFAPPASEYYYLSEDRSSEYLNSILTTGAYKYLKYQENPDNQTIRLLFTNKNNQDKKDTIALEISITDAQLIESITIGEGIFF